MLKQFLIMCSGAEKSILNDPRCSIERTKYAAIGATVLSTALLASLSGGYAIFVAFESVPKSVALGILWGLIIFNLDRYIVSSLRRQRISPNLTQKERVAARIKEINRAVPRFLLAILIAVVITRPIELRLFAREINAYVEEEKSKKWVEMEHQKRLEFPKIAELTSENVKLQEQVTNKESHCNELHELAMAEASGKLTTKTSGDPGKGPLFTERWANYEACRADLGELRKQIDLKVAANEREISAAEAERDASMKAARAKIEAMDGLLMRLKAHSYLTSQNISLFLASLFIVGLFILLETAPIIVKLLSERGPYEDVYEAKEHEVYVAERRRISNINDDANTRVTLKSRRNAAILEAESRLRKSLIASMETLAGEELKKARRDVAETLVRHWKSAELRNYEARFGSVQTENGNKSGVVVNAPDSPAETASTGHSVDVEQPKASKDNLSGDVLA